MSEKGASTRRDILDLAVREARAVGLAGVTIGRLAEAASLSKSGLFAHFGSKEALQIAILDHAAEEFIENVVRPAIRAPRGAERLRALFERWLAWGLDGQRSGGCLFVAAAMELDDQPGPVRDRLVALQREWLGVLGGVVERGQAQGLFRGESVPDDVAHELHGVLLDAHHAARLLRDGSALPRARRLFEGLLARHLPS
jgi:AcrR family transcriptional regulator